MSISIFVVFKNKFLGYFDIKASQNSKSTIRMAYSANYPDKLKVTHSLKTQYVTIELPEDTSLWVDLLFN